MNVLSEVVERFAHKHETFDLALPTGNALRFRVLRTHADFIAHKKARAAECHRFAEGRHFPPAEKAYLPVSEETALGIANLILTYAGQVRDGEFEPEAISVVDLLKLQSSNAAIFESLVQEWSQNQAFEASMFEVEVIDEMGKDLGTITSDS